MGRTWTPELKQKHPCSFGACEFGQDYDGIDVMIKTYRVNRQARITDRCTVGTVRQIHRPHSTTTFSGYCTWVLIAAAATLRKTFPV